MEWISCLKKAVAYMEAHLEDELDVAAVARHVSVSPFYLERGFQILTGYTLGEYVRNRRLYEAALTLARTDETVLDVALRYGYGTPESFAKAFSRFHGATPAASRRDTRLIRRFLPLNIRIEITGGNKMDYIVERMQDLTVIGFERVFPAETAQADIPAFWDEMSAKYAADTAPDSPQRRALLANHIGEFGVCVDDLGAEKFRYLIAGRYQGGDVPEGMTLYTVPGGDWAKFRCVGAIPAALQTLNNQIFREWLPGNPDYEMSGSCNLEWYSKKDTSAPDYESGVWIPVKHR